MGRFDELAADLHSTDPAVRDAAALGLSQLGDGRALQPLLRAIADPATEGHRGPLVHALGGCDAAPIVPELVQLIIHGSIDVSREALTVLENIDGVIATPVWNAAHAEVARALDRAGDDKRELLEALLELFED